MKRSVIIAVAGVGVAVVAAVIALNYRPGPDQTAEKAVPEEAPAPSQAGEPAVSPPPLEAPSEEALPLTRAAPGTPMRQAAVRERPPAEAAAPPSEPGPVAPSFDVVRIEPGGEAVVAGRAAPHAEVTILDRGKEVGRVTADRRGEWVWLPKEPFAPGTSELGLSAKLPGEEPVEGDVNVVLVVPEPKKDIAGRATEGPAESLVLKVPREPTKPTVVLQAPPPVGAAEEGRPGALTLDVVDYDDAGRLILSGRAEAGARLQVYLDNALLGESVADASGAWTLSPGQTVAPGLYTLRVDQVTDAGKVVARVELPFARAEPLQELAGGAYVIVQPGNSLWRIARRTYGRGVRYAVIYQANQGQIRDPDLIYPGQIFTLPKAD